LPLFLKLDYNLTGEIMSTQDKINSYIRNLPKNPSDKYTTYKYAKQWYETQIVWDTQQTYNQFIRLVIARIGL
jgi:hypothetical protein